MVWYVLIQGENWKKDRGISRILHIDVTRLIWKASCNLMVLVRISGNLEGL